MCMGVLLALMSVHHMYIQYPQRPEKGIRSPGIGVREDSECHVGVGSCPDPLEEPPLLLTPGPSLSPFCAIFTK